MVVGEEACPYTKLVDVAATGLLKQGVMLGPVVYSFSDTTDACATVGVFWNCVCELISKPQEVINTTILSLPGVGAGTDPDSFK